MEASLCFGMMSGPRDLMPFLASFPRQQRETPISPSEKSSLQKVGQRRASKGQSKFGCTPDRRGQPARGQSGRDSPVTLRMYLISARSGPNRGTLSRLWRRHGNGNEADVISESTRLVFREWGQMRAMRPKRLMRYQKRQALVARPLAWEEGWRLLGRGKSPPLAHIGRGTCLGNLSCRGTLVRGERQGTEHAVRSTSIQITIGVVPAA